MKIINQFLKIGIVFVLVFIMLCGCKQSAVDTPQKPNDTAETDNNPSKISIGAYSTENPNPLLVKSGYNEQMNFLIYDGLYQIGPTYEAVQNLATGYEIEDNGYTVQVFLKPNVHFHDGSKLTAQDVKATVNFLLENPGYYSHQVRNIKSIRAVDDYTIQFTLSELTPNLKLQLTFPIVCKKELLNAANFRLNGTGAYKVSSQTPGKQIILEQNKDYHKPFSSNITQIEVSLIPDKEPIFFMSKRGY